MKITFFSLNRLAFTGGAEKYILEVSRVFKQKGHEVTYLGDCRPLLTINVLVSLISGIKSFKGMLVEFHQLRQAPSFPEGAISFITPRPLKLGAFVPLTVRYREARKLLKSSDLVFVKNEILDMLAFWWLSLFSGKSKAVLLVFSSFYYPSQTFRGRLHNLFYLSPFYARLVRRFGRIVVSNRADTEFLAKRFGVAEEKIKLVPYGLNPADFPVPRFAPRETGVFRILFVGRLEEQKGIDILVEVVRRLVAGATPPRKNPSGLIPSTRRVEESAGRAREEVGRLRFTIIGDGPGRQSVEGLAKELPPVAYLGELPRPRVIQEYWRHDLLLVPSRWETFSYVTLEAQFCGLPVVAFNIPGPQDIIEEGKTGKLVTLGDIASFVRAVEGYVERGVDNVQRDYIRRRAQENFSVEKTAAALLKL